MSFRGAASVISFVTGIGAIVAFLASPGVASNYDGFAVGGCNDVAEADNATHNFQYVDLSAAMDSATDYIRVNIINPTPVNTSIDSTPDSHTDVIVRDRYYVDYCGQKWAGDTTAGVVGLYVCDNIDYPAVNCDQATVRYSNYYVDDASQTDERKLACHENAHALGLEHRDGGCVQDPAAEGGLYFSSHDRDHINDNY